MARKKTPNIDFILKMAEDFADMINYYLFEKAFDIHKNAPEEDLRKIMKEALEELYSPDLI